MARWVVFCVLSISCLGAMTTSQSQYYDDDDENTYVDVEVWYGPGFYNGVWFGNEDDYHDWHNNNHHDYNHQHYDGGHDHRGPEERGDRGGGHGGGHGGGGHR